MKRFYPAWKYKRELIITNPSSTEGFQGSFILRYKPGMKKDFRDVRFSDKRGNQLSYYLELISNYNSCRVWLKLPANEKLIYLYYGNGGVTSASNGSTVFEFWNDLNTLSTSVWTVGGSGHSVSGSILTIQHATQSGYIESKATFAPNNIVEMRVAHQSGQRGPFGFRNNTSQKAAAWQGAAGSLLTDHRFAHNGTTGDWDNDGVNRSGTAYNIYGVAHIAAGPKYYVNYTYRGEITTPIPGAVNLPVHVYSYAGEGYMKVDWVRVRKYAATEPTITLGKKSTNQPKAYPWDNTITTSTSIGMIPEISMKYYLNAASSIGMKALTMFRYPQFFRTEAPGPYKAWKSKGDIRTPRSGASSVVNCLIRAFPGMAQDGRDLRFADTSGTELTYYIESLTDGIFSVLVEIPANTSKINFFYGNGLAQDESEVSIYSGPLSTETISKVYPSGIFGHFYQWKFKGDIFITSPDSQAVQLDVSIPILPGMARDGRDLRFSDTAEEPIPYMIDSVTSTHINCIVKVPALASSICFFYGNGTVQDASSPSDVFDFVDNFDTLSEEWSIVAGYAMVAGGTLRVSHPVANSLVRSASTYGPGTVLEMRVSHPSLNQFINGYFGVGNVRACWLGATGTDPNDYVHTHNGTTATTISDGVNRSGSTFYNYGIAYLEDEIKYYINGIYRRSLTTTLPSGDLPIGIYSEHNKGDVVVDWVRVRKYTTASATVGRHRPRKQSVYIVEEETPVERATVERHYPQRNGFVPYYEYIAGKSFLGMQASEPTYKERRELRDYSLVSCDISKSISDTYMQLSAEFADIVVPPEKSTIKYIARDPSGNQYVLFQGKVIANSPVLGYVGNTLRMQAADQSRNLAVQKIPWNYQIVSGDTMSWAMWVRTLLEPAKTGVVINTIIDTDAESTQFVFDPKTSRLEAIQEIADYTNSIINIKLIPRTVNEITITQPEFFMVPPALIDQTANGFDLPAPLTFSWPDNSLVDQPEIVSEPDEKYNKVIVYGVLSDTQETTVAAAYSPAVYMGEEKAREYIIEDNSIFEKGSTAEREAIKWLLYFLTPRATVQMKFVNRFDFELYQRIRFGSGFPLNLQALTNSVQVPYVVAFDPRDEANSTHTMDVSGVPVPSWLRITEIKYHGENLAETVEIKAITDFIYSSVDPVINAPYSDYLSPGYRKPIIEDLIATTQSIVDDTVEKQLQPEICTVLSQNEENKTAVVQTASGKLVTVRLP